MTTQTMRMSLSDPDDGVVDTLAGRDLAGELVATISAETGQATSLAAGGMADVDGLDDEVEEQDLELEGEEIDEDEDEALSSSRCHQYLRVGGQVVVENPEFIRRQAAGEYVYDPTASVGCYAMGKLIDGSQERFVISHGGTSSKANFTDAMDGTRLTMEGHPFTYGFEEMPLEKWCARVGLPVPKVGSGMWADPWAIERSRCPVVRACVRLHAELGVLEVDELTRRKLGKGSMTFGDEDSLARSSNWWARAIRDGSSSLETLVFEYFTEKVEHGRLYPANDGVKVGPEQVPWSEILEESRFGEFFVRLPERVEIERAAIAREAEAATMTANRGQMELF